MRYDLFSKLCQQIYSYITVLQMATEAIHARKYCILKDGGHQDHGGIRMLDAAKVEFNLEMGI